MSVEADRMTLTQDLYSNIDFRYPLCGSDQYNFNSGNKKTVFRGKEPFNMVYPAVKVEFLRPASPVGQKLNNFYDMVSGIRVFAYAEVRPVIITAYVHQQCRGNDGNAYHGKLVADAYIQRIESRVRKYWPSILRDMEASIYIPFPFVTRDISDFQQGTERQAFELTFNIVATKKWDYMITDTCGTYDPCTGYVFTDAYVSGIDTASYDAGMEYEKTHTLSGLVNL